MSQEDRPPGPRGPAKWGQLLRARRDPIGFLAGLRDRYGDVAFFRVGPARFYVLSHPEYAADLLEHRSAFYAKGKAEVRTAARLLGEGLLASEGDLHAHERHVIEPLMSSRVVARFADVAVEFAGRTAQRWQNGKTVDVEREMNGLTHAVVIRAMFGVDIDAPDAGPLPAALAEAAETYSRLPIPFSRLSSRLPIRANRRFERARARLDRIIGELVAARRAGGADDLLGDLVEAGISDRQVRDEAMTLFLPGRKPLATALTWTWFLLSGNPGVEARLHADVDAALGGRERLTAEDLPRLVYTRMVLSEALRLYPPAWIVLRKATRDHDMGPHRIRAGSSVVASHFVIQHDARFNPAPERFDPDRWAPGRDGERVPFSWFPFGGGDRRCIGEAFAWMEGVLALATIAHWWRLRLVPDHPVELWPKVTLLPRHGMAMVPERRRARGDRPP